MTALYATPEAADVKAKVDCRDLVEQELGLPAHIHSEYSTWPCPFHIERTVGAFHVYVNGYRCFSCGAAGDQITWLMKRRGIDFLEALEYLNGGRLDAVDPDELLRIAREREERAADEYSRKLAEAQEALGKLRSAQAWVRYYENLTAQSRELWLGRGIPDYFISWWQLGYCPDYKLWRKEGGEWVDYYHTPTLTIPIWSSGWQPSNLKHRLLNPPDSGDKYRQEYSHLPASPFICNPDISSGPAILVEGEIKSMVAFVSYDSANIQMAGLPSATPDGQVFSSFTNYDPIYLMLDPDAFERKHVPGKPEQPSPVERAVELLGRDRVRVVTMPMKVDDAINAGALDKWSLRAIIAQARKPL